MPSNFHRVLHARLDSENWGPMASWTFPFESLHGLIMLATRHSNCSAVTQTIVKVKRQLVWHASSKSRLTSAPFCCDPGLEHIIRDVFAVKTNIIGDRNRTWRRGNFVCVVRANHSVGEHSAFVVAAVMQKKF